MEIHHPSPSLSYTAAVHKTTLEASSADVGVNRNRLFAFSVHIKHFLTTGLKYFLGQHVGEGKKKIKAPQLDFMCSVLRNTHIYILPLTNLDAYGISAILLFTTG